MIPEDKRLTWRYLRNKFPKHYFRGDEPLFSEILDSNLSYPDRFLLVQMYQVYHQLKLQQLFEQSLRGTTWTRLSEKDRQWLRALDGLKPRLPADLRYIASNDPDSELY
jgi:hypothetical protein